MRGEENARAVLFAKQLLAEQRNPHDCCLLAAEKNSCSTEITEKRARRGGRGLAPARFFFHSPPSQPPGRTFGFNAGSALPDNAWRTEKTALLNRDRSKSAQRSISWKLFLKIRTRQATSVEFR